MGASFLGTLRTVVLPLSMPGIVAGALLVFTLSASSFITPSLMGGARIQVLAKAGLQVGHADTGVAVRGGAGGDPVRRRAAGADSYMRVSTPRHGCGRYRPGCMLATVLVALTVLVLLAPLVVVIGVSFSQSEFIAFPPQGFGPALVRGRADLRHLRGLGLDQPEDRAAGHADRHAGGRRGGGGAAPRQAAGLRRAGPPSSCRRWCCPPSSSRSAC
ncbi:MAG: hypothetical protein U1F00_03940 [Rhodoferax sp.]